MMLQLNIFIFIVLALASVLDLKFKTMPRFLLTTALLVVVAVSISTAGINQLGYGVIAFFFALLLYDVNFFRGTADIKAMVMLGLVVSSMTHLLILLGLFMVCAVVYVLLYRWRIEDTKDVPLIPVIFIVYAVLIILQLVL